MRINSKGNIMKNYLFTRVSGNEKTGPIPVTYSPSHTCPDACSLKHSKECYAKLGNVARIWRKVDNKQWGNSWENLLSEVKKIPKNNLWRHNLAGDLEVDNNTIDHFKLD